MTTSSTSSTTPILDLIAPLPKPQKSKLGRKDYRVPIFAVAAILVSGNYELLFPLLGLLLGLWLIVLFGIAVHELGHVAAGYSSGFIFQSAAVGPIEISRESARWKINVRHSLLTGLTSMSLDRFYKVRKRLMIYNAAGPAAGLLLGTAAIECLRLSIEGDRPVLSLIFMALAASSIFLSVGSLVPMRHSGIASDGMNLKVLLLSKEGTARILATYALHLQLRKGVDRVSLNGRWSGLACSRGNVAADPRYSTYSEDWAAYQAATSPEAAAQFLERCLANSGFLGRENRDSLIAEASRFTASRRNDAEKAEIWFQRVADPERLHPLVRLRVRVALSCARGRFDDALEQAKAGIETIRTVPAFGSATESEAAWLEWCRQIEVLRDQRLPAKS